LSAKCFFLCLRRREPQEVRGICRRPVCSYSKGTFATRWREVAFAAQTTPYPVQELFLAGSLYTCIKEWVQAELHDLRLWFSSTSSRRASLATPSRGGKPRQEKLKSRRRLPIGTELAKIMCALFMPNQTRVFSLWVPKGFALCGLLVGFPPKARPQDVRPGRGSFDKHCNTG
jgi:hypothetical protein